MACNEAAAVASETSTNDSEEMGSEVSSEDSYVVTPRPPLNGTLSSGSVSENSPSKQAVYRRNNSIESDFTQLRARYYGDDDTHHSSTKSFLILGAVFLCAILGLLIVYLSFPNLDENEKQYIKLPTNIEDAKSLGKVLSKYTDTYYYQVLLGYFSTYIFLQSFAIPGSIFLSILSGFLFPFPLALFLVCLCSATGASFCYILFYLVGRRLVWRYFPKKAAEWSSHVNRNRQHLLNYIIFLRITPFLPNWFINIASPVINVPLVPFFAGTFIGVAPPSFLAIKAGTTIHELTSSGDTVSWTSLGVLGLLALFSLLPVIFKEKLKKKFD